METSNKLTDLVPYDDIDDEKINIILIDDMVKEKDQDKLEDYIMRIRKKNCSFIYLTQSFFDVPLFIRSNCDIFHIYGGEDMRKINTIHTICGIGTTKEEFRDIYEKATANPYDFLNIDKVPPYKDGVPSTRYRRNWDSLYFNGSFIPYKYNEVGKIEAE